MGAAPAPVGVTGLEAMAEAADSLFPDEPGPAEGGAQHPTGILPAQAIRDLLRGREILATEDVIEGQIQPASLDLRLGGHAYRVQASFLPGTGGTVAERLDRLAMHRFDLADGAVLEKGCVYIVPLMESLALGSRLSAFANPKSSTGRLDIFTRVITDHGAQFDRIRAGYHGPLYAEISPRTFSVVVHEGSRLSQLRLRLGNPPVSDAALRRLHEQVRLVDRAPEETDIDNGIAVTVDLTGEASCGLLGYRARHHTGLIDVNLVDHYDPLEFWEPIHARSDGTLILKPDEFYILASKEAVTVPPDHAAEMVAYDTLVGEFRVHYAGFFDPGFGHAESGGAGSRAVLEVRSHEVPFVLQDGQVVGRLMYERLTQVPEKVYGSGIGSSYQRQGLALSKQFKRA